MRELKNSEINHVSGGKLDLSGFFDGSFAKEVSDFLNNTIAPIFKNTFDGISKLLTDGFDNLKNTITGIIGGGKKA
ncbi:hypothetical protein QNH14_18205 [Apirhabdus apintestini]|uniref:hypothetical protein n=1 Tax=Erwinia sp. HR93 TaxID=3094840 RepID=UPI002ADEB790|nr:hypothetical protein [Erwinia sp. HR93]MEA1062449.1 hypothetical protein [Erwinia sp. HR93]WPM84558.1 hypothetical protein QNH14_18205 [Enterobacteriaceae bacterium CA-0114]